MTQIQDVNTYRGYFYNSESNYTLNFGQECLRHEINFGFIFLDKKPAFTLSNQNGYVKNIELRPSFNN